MARLNGGLFSKLKGKLAGVVFQQYEGMNVSKEYQPNVKNPNTANQIAVRASFKLASQFTAIYEYVLLPAAAKVSIYTRMIRGKVVATLRSTIGVEGGENPILKLEDAAASINAIQLTSPVAMPTINGTTISNATIQATEGDIVRYTIVAYDNESNILGTANNKFIATSTPEPVLAPRTTGTPSNYDIIAVAIRSMTSEGNAIYSNINAGYSLEAIRLINSGDAAVSHVASANLSQA